MPLSTEHLINCIKILDSSLVHLQQVDSDSIEYEIFRNAAIKGFELTLETAGKLLRKALKLYSSAPSLVDELIFKDVLRNASKHGLLQTDAVERWFQYRNNRNNTAHDYAKVFAEATVKLLPRFLKDVRQLETTLQCRNTLV